MILFGIAMGLLFAVAYSLCLGRVGQIRPRALALLVAAGGFVGVYLVPFVKYPANPPSIGHPETIRERSRPVPAHGGVLGRVPGSSRSGWASALRPRFGNWNATLLAAVGYLVAIGLVLALLPSLGHLAYNVQHFGGQATETPLPFRNAHGGIVYPGFPADVLFSFRLLSVAAQLLLWTVIGLCFGPMAERVLVPRQVTAPAAPQRDPVSV